MIKVIFCNDTQVYWISELRPSSGTLQDNKTRRVSELGLFRSSGEVWGHTERPMIEVGVSHPLAEEGKRSFFRNTVFFRVF
jgi:hypothetical protein